VRNNPLSRSYQEKFVNLKQQLDTIIGILEDQQRVLVALDDSIKEGETKSVIAESLTKIQGRESSIVEFCLQSAEETLQNFVEMARRSSDLESWVSDALFFRNVVSLTRSALPHGRVEQGQAGESSAYFHHCNRAIPSSHSSCVYFRHEHERYQGHGL